MPSQAKPNRAAWLEGSSNVCAPQPGPTHPWRLILLGAPGVGKGTQADLLSQRLGACHLSTGDVLRNAGQSVSEPTPAMTAARDCMQRGALVPDHTVWEIVRERSACIRCRGGFILDGFPRTRLQAELLNQLIADEGISLDAVVNYEMPIAKIVERLSGRRICKACKAVYHVTRQPSKTDGVCDTCGENLFHREDDRPEAVTVRMETYERSTAPLIEFYRDFGLLLPVAAAGSPEEICARTMEALQNRKS